MSEVKLPPQIAANPAINQWFGFALEGRVELKSGKVEIGQGINTALVQIAADELDVAFDQIDLVSGDTRSTPDEGLTAGSRSVQTGGLAVRYAASAARTVMLVEAAKLLQATVTDLTVVEGVIHIGDRSTDLTYWTLARNLDFGADIADNARPKLVSERRLSGQSVPRSDLPAKVRGAPSYIYDLEFPGMAHARVVRPPYPTARVLAFDEVAVAGATGVIAVIRDGSFIGVIAEREEQAIAAAGQAARDASWTAAQSAPSDPLAVIAATQAEEEVGYERGSVSEARGRQFSTTVSRHFLSHGSIGPSCAIALWRDGGLQVHTHSQGVFPLRSSLAAVLGLDEEAISVVHSQGAGCYGHNGADDAALDAALLARALPGRPVRVVWSRSDEFAWAPLGPAMVTTATAVLGEDDHIAALTVAVASPPHSRRPKGATAVNMLASEHLERPVPSPNAVENPLSIGGAADRNSVPLYSIANLRSSKRLIHDLPWRTSSMRGLGATINILAIETLMDDIAAEIGADPLEFRLNHLDDQRAREVLERAAAASGWPGPQGDGVGLGLAFSRYKNTAAYCALVLRVELGEDIRVTNVWAAVDAGESVNPDGIANQIEGGIVQATSWTLKEAVSFDGEAVTSIDWETYPILGFAEIPEISVEIIARPELPPLGVGEAAQGPTAAAISNAIRRAVGTRIRTLPITRDAVVAALA